MALVCNALASGLAVAIRSGQGQRSIKAAVEPGRTGVANVRDGVGGRHGGEVLPGELVGGGLNLMPTIELLV